MLMRKEAAAEYQEKKKKKTCVAIFGVFSEIGTVYW